MRVQIIGSGMATGARAPWCCRRSSHESAGTRRSVCSTGAPSAAGTAVGSEAGTAVGTAVAGRSAAGEGSPGVVEQAAGAGEDAEVVQVSTLHAASIARISLLMALSAGAQASVAQAGSSMLGSGDGAPVSCNEA